MTMVTSPPQFAPPPAAAAAPAAPVPPPAPTDPISLNGGAAAHDEEDEGPEEKTRIGVPAYEASAKKVTDDAKEPEVERPETSMFRPRVAGQADAPSLLTAQAVRVVVWRGPDGVRVAPYGTKVSAIAVDAILVALDPTADLADWLTEK
jgi:hypothetical protein